MRRATLLIALIVGLIAASAIAIALRPTVLGLDLQGGVEVTLQGKPTEEAQVTEEAIQRSVEIIRSRVDAFGVAEPEIQTQGDDQINVALPGAENPQQVVDDLIKPAQLQFIDFEANVVNPEGTTSLLEAIRLAQRTEPEADRGLPTFYAFDEADRQVGGPAVDRRTLLEGFPGDRLPEGVRVEVVPRGLFLAYEESARLQTRDAGTQRTWYVFQNRPGLTGQDITEARSQLDTRAIGGTEPIVTMQFTDEGRQKFADITRDLAVRGFNRGEVQRFAIILDGQMVSNPTVDYREYPTGIDGRNGAQIQGNFSTGEAQTLADQINSGALPIELEVISQRQVSATLGKESLNQGLIAGIAGLALVLAFLIGYYRFLGLVAGLGLMIYAVLFYAVIVLVPITLTLPGIAGIILTIGVASDANVVIFERVREEARAGRSAKAAVLNGYRKGITAIIDANVVTLATAVILFLFATAGVKGFAFTLFIGVLLSLFTAVVATRAIFEVVAETRFLRDDRWMGLHQRQPRWKMDWVGKWKLWMALSFIPVAMGVAYLGFFGLNLGLDFESGTRIATTFERQPTETQVRRVVGEAGYPEAKIQATTEQIDGETVRGFQIQVPALQPPEQQELRRALDAEFGINEEAYQLELVGPTFGEQIIRNAIYAIVLSFIVIAIYLSVRFEYKLALPAMLSVVQDVLLTIGIYSVTGREVTSATVAALLTILGYSLYDVVIVFDRIRENVPKMRRATYREVVNTSIHEVLTRSIITMLTTLLPVTALFLFGGDTLKDFAFALLVGILSGGTSSILISAPLAALWKEREPEDRRRRTREEKRRAKVLADADVVDLDTLARAEMALEAEIAADEEAERREEDEGRRALPAGGETAAAEPVPAPEPRTAPEPEGAPEPAPGRAKGVEPATVPAGDGADEGGDRAPDTGAQTPRPRRRGEPGRVRRHQQVQRRRRR